MKAIGKLSIGCITCALALQGYVFAATQSVAPALAASQLVCGQTDSADETARRREADKSLRQAREDVREGLRELPRLDPLDGGRFRAQGWPPFAFRTRT